MKPDRRLKPALCLLLLVFSTRLWAHGTIEGTVLVTASPRQETHSAEDDLMGEDDSYGNGARAPEAKTPPLPEEIVVYLQKVPGHFKPPAEPAKLDQKFVQFTHRVLPILVGTTVEFTNHDPVYHNVFSNSTVNKFDLGRKKRDEKASYTFTRPEVPVRIYCEIHSKMDSNILVLQNPYFAVVQPGGSFKLQGVPDGTYTLVAWHDYWKPVRQKVTVRKGRTVSVKLVLSKVRI